jgi:hypothetical protein
MAAKRGRSKSMAETRRGLKVERESSPSCAQPALSSLSFVFRRQTVAAAFGLRQMVLMKAKVSALKVSPDTILDDIERLCSLADMKSALQHGATTILKDNISWHFPFPGANTTPWQLEGTVRSLRARGLTDLVCVQNKTVVTDAFKGEDLNGYVPIFRHHGVPVRYNFKPEDMTWSVYRPRA